MQIKRVRSVYRSYTNSTNKSICESDSHSDKDYVGLEDISDALRDPLGWSETPALSLRLHHLVPALLRVDEHSYLLTRVRPSLNRHWCYHLLHESVRRWRLLILIHTRLLSYAECALLLTPNSMLHSLLCDSLLLLRLKRLLLPEE